MFVIYDRLDARGNSMNKFAVKTFVLLGLMFCATGALSAKAAKVSVTTTVDEINQHGNTYLTIKPSVFSAKGFSVSDIVTVTVGAKKIDMPICRSYSDVNSGEYLLRLTDESICLAINMGNFAQNTGAELDMQITITMKQQYGYLTQYHQRILKSTENRSDYASDEVFANFREVTVGNILSGRLYRSSSPIEQNARAPYASKLAQTAGVATVINITDSEESAAALVKANPYYASLVQNGAVQFEEMAVSYSDDTFNSQLKEILTFMAEHDGPYLIHGKNGQNRTGTVVALLEALCGATVSEITTDYMTSYENYYGIKKDSTQYKEMTKTIEAMFQTLNGGKKVQEKGAQKVVEKYLLQTVGLTQSQIDAIKAKLTK